MAATATQPGVVPEVDVAGKDLPGTLVAARVDRAMGLVGRAVLRFAPVPTDWRPGSAPLTFDDPVRVSAPNGGPVLFQGLVTGVELEQHHGRRELVVTADDAAAKLTLGTQTKAYVGQSYSAILTEIARRAGLSVVSGAPADTATPTTYYLHSGTDLEFLDHVAERTGRVWWVEPGNKLRWEATDVSDSTVDLQIGDGDTFSVRATGLKPEAVEVVGWDAAKQDPFIGSATTERADEPVLAQGFPGEPDNRKRLVVRDASPLSPAEATALAGSVAAAAAGEAVRVRGETAFAPRLAPAVSIRVSGTGVLDGTFRLTQVEHVYQVIGGLRTRFTAGPIRPSGLVDVLGGRRRTGGHLLEGVVSGVVTNLNDQTGQGRVRVKFSTQGDQVESAWARLLTIGAGAERGLEFQPEVGDEVLLAFELGDARRPVVLGGLYSDVNKLPESPDRGNVASGKVTYRRITTRLGHVLELADGTGPETQHVRIALGGKKDSIRLGEDKTEIRVDHKPVTITNGDATITLSDKGDVTIEGANITLKAKQAVKIEGAQVDVKGSGTTKVEGGQLSVKASSAAEVNGGGTLALKGGTVMIN
jgi:uncharacterized protein involved in type VI secretion and phage assembly